MTLDSTERLRTAAAALAAALGIAAVVAFGGLAWTVLVALVLLGLLVVLWPQSGLAPRVLWWMHPAWGLVIAAVPGVALAAVIPQQYFVEKWNTPKFVEFKHGVLVVALVAAFALGAVVAQRLLRPGRQELSLDRLPPQLVARLVTAARILFWFTVVGYVLWTIVGVSRGLRPGDVAGALTGGAVSSLKRDYLQPVAGVTTLTQFGPLAIAALVLLRHLKTEFPAGRYLAALFVLALLRTVVYAERLALLELVIPMAVLALVLRPARTRRRPALTLLPLWAPVAVLLFFGTFEYLRSWSSHYKEAAGGSYAAFTTDRVGAYYATALNNSVLNLDEDNRTTAIPFHSISGFWNLPGVPTVLPYEQLAGTDVNSDWNIILESRANPEFTNRGGFLLPVFDLGVPAAVVFWFGTGAFLGWAFALFKRFDVRGLLLYPVLFVGCLEAGRILYWPQGRALPSIVGGLVLGLALLRAAQPATPGTARGPSPGLPSRTPGRA